MISSLWKLYGLGEAMIKIWTRVPNTLSQDILKLSETWIVLDNDHYTFHTKSLIWIHLHTTLYSKSYYNVMERSKLKHISPQCETEFMQRETEFTLRVAEFTLRALGLVHIMWIPPHVMWILFHVGDKGHRGLHLWHRFPGLRAQFLLWPDSQCQQAPGI